MRFSGRFEVGAPPQRCLERLRDPSWLSQCLPSLVSFEDRGAEGFRAVFYQDLSGLAQLSGYLSRIRTEMSFRYEDTGPSVVKLVGEGRVVGTKIRLTIVVKVSERGVGSALDWEAEADLGLVQRILGEKLVRQVAENQIQALTLCLGEKLSSPV